MTRIRVAALAVATTLALTGSVISLTSTATADSAAAAAKHSQKIVFVRGKTYLKFDPATAKVLAANKISVRPVSESRVSKKGVSFPISGGFVDAASLKGHINHVGGLRFIAGGKKLTARDFTINTTTARLSGYVDQVRATVPLLKLNLGKAKIALHGSRLVVSNVKATLTNTAAKALNGYFGVSLFTKGLSIGTARVSAHVRVFKS